MPNRTALQAAVQAQQLLVQADAALRCAGGELSGESARLAARLATQIGLLSEVAELLAHEIERERALTQPVPSQA